MIGPFAPRTTKLIGRQQHVQAVLDAIAQKNTCHVIYFTGVGGIGKTRILEEIDAIAKQVGGSFLWSKIIDLYSAQNHSVGDLQQAIAQGVDPYNEWFGDYRRQQAQLEEQLDSGVGGPVLEELRNKVNKAFLDAYAAAAQQKRLVLAFDTVELIQYENDVVQRICQVEDPDTEIKSWFSNNLGILPNTVTLLAGRPRPRTQWDFQQAFEKAGCAFELRELTGFTDEEFEDYLADLSRQDQTRAEELQQAGLKQYLKSLAAGLEQQGIRPIRLALLIDLLTEKQGLGTLTPETIDAQLVRRLHERAASTPVENAIYWLLYARKGLDAALLAHLESCSEGEATAILTQLDPNPDPANRRRAEGVVEETTTTLTQSGRPAIVKKYHGDERYFAHDELYDMFDRYFKGDASHRQEYRRIRDYYRGLEKAAQTPAMLEEVRLSLLFYELQVNPDQGYYACYAQLDEEAIGNHETDFDMRLRDEALRFHNRYVFEPDGLFYDPTLANEVDAAKIHRDCAVRWVKRFIARGKLRQAIQAAENARFEASPIFNWAKIKDPLYKSALLSAWGQALTYSGGDENEIKKLFDEAIQESANGSQRHDGYHAWWKARILGVAHNNYGYFHRTRGRYGAALEQYRHALRYFQSADIKTELANTSNNMAFLLALLGRNRAAKFHINEAISIREAEATKRPYQLALSRNTKGLIWTLDDHPVWGERFANEALREGERLNEPRLIGLACIGLGFALRRKAEQWEQDTQAITADIARQSYHDAEKALVQAAAIFEGQITEPLRLWEAYNELGSLFCDWAHFTLTEDDDLNTAKEQYVRSIHYQLVALKLAQTNRFELQIADSLDDLAHVYSEQGKLLYRMELGAEAKESWQTSESYLGEIEAHIPAEYRLQEGVGFDPQLAAGDFYWLQRGKLHLQRAIWAFRDHELTPTSMAPQTIFEKGARQFALAAAYLIQFWPESHAFGNTMDAMMKRLRRNNVPAELARQTVMAVAHEYNVDLSTVLRRIEDTLGTS